MAYSPKQFSRLATLALVVTGMVAMTYPAIAKQKPQKPIQQNTVESVTSTVSHGEYWQDLLDELGSEYQDIPTTLLEGLREDLTLQDDLLGLFLGQSGDRQAITDILLDILLGQDYNDHDSEGYVTEGIHYTYTIDRACLPPGQRQRLDSGKPIPPGILKKCGQIETVDF